MAKKTESIKRRITLGMIERGEELSPQEQVEADKSLLAMRASAEERFKAISSIVNDSFAPLRQYLARAASLVAILDESDSDDIDTRTSFQKLQIEIDKGIPLTAQDVYFIVAKARNIPNDEALAAGVKLSGAKGGKNKKGSKGPLYQAVKSIMNTYNITKTHLVIKKFNKDDDDNKDLEVLKEITIDQDKTIRIIENTLTNSTNKDGYLEFYDSKNSNHKVGYSAVDAQVKNVIKNLNK